MIQTLVVNHKSNYVLYRYNKENNGTLEYKIMINWIDNKTKNFIITEFMGVETN